MMPARLPKPNPSIDVSRAMESLAETLRLTPDCSAEHKIVLDHMQALLGTARWYEYVALLETLLPLNLAVVSTRMEQAYRQMIGREQSGAEVAHRHGNWQAEIAAWETIILLF
jgi:hypothetical protein